MHGSSWMQPMKRAYLGRVECCYPGAMAEARWTFWQISESVVTKSIKQLLFPGKTEQTRWRKKGRLRWPYIERLLLPHPKKAVLRIPHILMTTFTNPISLFGEILSCLYFHKTQKDLGSCDKTVYSRPYSDFT